MQVHPDLFGRFPEEKQRNEESFALLSAIIDAVQKQDGAPNTLASSRQTLQFFLLPDAKDVQKGNEEATEDEVKASGGGNDRTTFRSVTVEFAFSHPAAFAQQV